MKGDAAMTQDIIVWALLVALVGLFWVMALAILDDAHHTHDKKQARVSPEPHDGFDPHERLPRRSSVSA
jgi:hypothetical protein